MESSNQHRVFKWQQQDLHPQPFSSRMSTKSFNQICCHLNLAKEFLDIQAKWYDTNIQSRVFSHLLFWNFCVATKSIKSSRTYQQCQLSLLHNKICQKKPNTRVLRKEIDFSPFYITGRETNFINFAHVLSLF